MRIARRPGARPHSRMHENQAPVLGDMRVVLESERAIHPNEASVQRLIRAVRGNTARPQIEGTQMHECEAGVHSSLSPVQGVIVRARGSHASLQNHNARVRRGSACLHMSYAHVRRDMLVVH
jgi:hypothetical protein